MNSAQKKKILALIAFVCLLVLTSFFLYKKLVKPSPYYPQPETETIDE